MQKITPFLWFDGKAEEAANFYASTFRNAKVNTITYWGEGAPFPKDQVKQCIFEINGLQFYSFDAGPHFKINPAISFFVYFNTKEELETTWAKLSAKGKVLMPLNTYPWSESYGWCADEYGVNWQLMLDSNQGSSTVPSLLFTQHNSGKAAQAIELYTSLFKNSGIKSMSPYLKDEGDVEGYIKHAQFTLEGQLFACMDSSAKHDFVFNEAISFFVHCNDQEEVDYFWDNLTANGGQESQCSWLKDRFGVSWQIVPKVLADLISSKDKAKAGRAMQAMMKMKKIIVADIEKAANG